MFRIVAEKGAGAVLAEFRARFEAQVQQGGMRGALAARAYEQMLRVAGVVAFGEAAMDGTLSVTTCSASTVRWAGEFVDKCLDVLAPEAEEHAADTETERLQKTIMRVARDLPKGGDGCFRHRDLLHKVKGRGRSSRDVASAISILIEAGDLEVQMVEVDGKKRPASPKRYRIGQV